MPIDRWAFYSSLWSHFLEEELMKTKEFGILPPPKVDVVSYNKKRRELYLEGIDYLWGKNGKEENKEKAYELIKQSAEMNYSYAINAIGSFHYKGLVVEQDYQKAFSLYKSMYERLNPNAAFNLSKMYARGEFVNQNGVISRFYFYRAISFSCREILKGETIARQALQEELKLQYNQVDNVIRTYLKKPICEFCQSDIPAKNFSDLINNLDQYAHLEKKLENCIITDRYYISAPLVENGYCCCACHDTYVEPIKKALADGIIAQEEVEALGKRDDMLEALHAFLLLD